jgi:phage host-nuclease inhibitor protein Gam
MNIIDELKNLDTDRLSMDDLVGISARARAARTEYELYQLEVPELIDSKLRTLGREINTRKAEKLEKDLHDKKARLEAFKTPQERKAELKKDIKALEDQLAAIV